MFSGRNFFFVCVGPLNFCGKRSTDLGVFSGRNFVCVCRVGRGGGGGRRGGFPTSSQAKIQLLCSTQFHFSFSVIPSESYFFVSI